MLGKDWQEFTRKWLGAETTLRKAVRGSIGVEDIQSSDLPAALKAWGNAQITKTDFDTSILTEQFGQEMQGWWDGLGLKNSRKSDELLNYIWCRNGRTRIVMLVLGMCWWVKRSGGGTDWSRVVKEMTDMWELIAATPSL